MATASRARTITLPMPHFGQQRVLSELRRFNWLCAGRRWRKTTLFMAHMTEQALLHPGQEFIWSAPTYQQVRVGWDEMRRACGEVVEFNGSRMEALFPHESIVHFISLTDYDSKRGLTSFGTVIDEASEIPAASFYEVLRPMLMGTDGWLLAGGTPKGRNWFWEEFMKAPERSGHARWQIPTRGCELVNGRLIRKPHQLENPEIGFEEIEELYDQLGERRFRQEILAEFLDDAGGVFQQVRSNIRGQLEHGPATSHEYVMGVDLAKYQDFTVVVVVDRLERRVVDFHRFNQANWNLQKARIITIAQHWRNAQVWLDSTGVGDPIADDLVLAGLHIQPYKFSLATKRALIDHAVLCVEQHQISYPEIPVLINELESYEYQRTAGGALTMNAPIGQHDDCVVAFSLACWGLGRGSVRLPASALEQLHGKASEIGGITILRRPL